MKVPFNKIIWFPAIILLLLHFSCAPITGRKEVPPKQLLAYGIESNGTLQAQHAPLFVVENPAEALNRIGMPSAELMDSGKERIFVDPERAAIYTRRAEFRIDGKTFTNLVYRVHFQKVPSGIFPFHLGKGKNVGLLVIITLNERREPVLLTTVHTCGCYLAFIPTSFMPAEAFPDGWQTEGQTVYSEHLPGLLDYGGFRFETLETVITIRADTHRIKGISLVPKDRLKNYETVIASHQPMDALERLPLEVGKTTSFYETSGPRRGYVKGSHKLWERVFMSWWALDWRIGEDKKLGKNSNDGIVFYTSLKPWERRSSDLRDFPAFLDFWGWNL